MEIKTIVYRGGVVTFRIPLDWVEEYGEQGGGTFYRKVPNSGTLCLYVTTMATEKPVTPEFVYTEAAAVSQGMLKSGRADIEHLSNGNTVVRHRRTSFSWFRRIVLHFWQVYNPVPPHHLRIALFSYTILKSRETAPETLQEIDMLDTEIRSAVFHPETGQ